MRKVLLTAVTSAVVGAALVLSMAAAAADACGICGKNLIKNPGAESGRGVNAVGAFGAVPGWTVAAGQFGAASYAFPNGWYSAKTKGPKARGKNYFFGGTTTAAVEARASIGTQTIKLPAAAVGRKATLSGWLGNYGQNRTQVRAEFKDASGAVLSTVRIGPAVTIAGTDMALRSRFGKVPAKTTQVTISVIFSGGGTNYKLAGADSLALVLS
ncbi:MAG TPA: hypothetical protein VMN35_02070 [Gaiellaceae bacterium]|nr:hypothetical protein [Gaiellaceae bacterium]